MTDDYTQLYGKKGEKDGSGDSMTGNAAADHIPRRCFILAYYPHIDTYKEERRDQALRHSIPACQ